MATTPTPAPNETETAIMEAAILAINLALRLFVKNPASQAKVTAILQDVDSVLQSIGI
jgi:hypothetical protein